MKLVADKYRIPFLLITSLFFLWGFARSVLDVLNKHFQDILDITILQSAFVQATTYLGYFIMALPAGIFITKKGYRKGVVCGLVLFAIGSFLFIPGEKLLSFEIFLIALFIIGCGLVMLETAANPYISELGDKSTASSRLNLAQSLNGLGCILGPVIVGGLLFSDSGGSVSIPYTVMGLIVIIAAVVFSKIKLPEKIATIPQEKTKDSFISEVKELWKSKIFRLGIITLFFYEIAEISINSLFINYVLEQNWMDKKEASALLSFGALGLFMVARIIGSGIMTKVSADKVLFFCGIGAMAGAIGVYISSGWLGATGLFACYAFEAIIFPTVFAITISNIRGNVKIASSFLMMTPIGGAVGTLMMGWIAQKISISSSFLIPSLAYAVVIIYSCINIQKRSTS